MRIGKRLLALVCTAALLLSLVGTAFAAGTNTTYTLREADCTYTVNPDGNTVTLTGINYLSNHSKTVIIPDSLDGKPVTAVKGKNDGTIFIHVGQYVVETLVLPAGITSFSPHFLDGYSSKKGSDVKFTAVEVSAENTVYKSEDGVLFSKDGSTLIYYPMDKLGSYIIPSSVTAIGDNAFYGAHNLTAITVPSGLLSIGKYGLALTGITTLTLPDTITTLGDYAFYSNYELTNLSLPATVTSVGKNLFSSCRKITTAELGMSTVPEGFLRGCSNLTSLTLQEGVTEIGEGAFYGCSSLAAVTFPASLRTVGKEAFAFDYKLASVTLNDGLTTIGEQAFWESGFSGALNLPASVTTLGKQAFEGTRITSIGSLGGVTHLPENVFCQCDLLTVVTVPSTIKTMDARVFYDCAGLQEITLPEGLTSIPSGAFQFMGSDTPLRENHLTKINIPDTVTSIGDSAFAGNYVLESIKLPKDLTTLGDRAFKSCRALKAIDIPAGVMSLGTSMFEDCWSLQDIKLPASLTEIGTSAFNRCYVLQRLEFPATLDKLGVSHSTNGGSDTYSDVFGYTPALLSVTFLGNKPNTGTMRPFATAPSEGHHKDLTVYYPLNNSTYGDWSKWTYPAIKTGTPTDPDAKDTEIALFAVLEHSRQGELLLWCTVDITPKTYSASNTLSPAGAVSFTLGGDALPTPIYLVGGNTSLHQTVGYRLSEDLLGKEITVQAHLAASVGFNASPSAVLTGTVVKPAWDKQLPFVEGGPGTIEGKYATTPDADGKGVIITKIIESALNGTDPTLPDKIGDLPVTGLGDHLFANNSFTARVTIPASVKTLGQGVFKDCLDLVWVQLPAGLTEIPENTFSGCANTLSTVTLPNTVTSIGANAFRDCKAIKTMILPASLETLDASAFSGCTLTEVAFEGDAPALPGYVSGEIFDHWTILTTKQGATGFDAAPWASMRREPVALGISFDPSNVTFTDQTNDGFTMLLPITFDTSAYGAPAPAPAPDLTKVAVYVYNNPMENVTVVDGKLSVPVDKKYFGLSPSVRVAYSGDWYYQAADSASLDVNMPTPKLPTAITAVTSEFTTEANGTIKLWITHTVTPTDYYGQSYKPSLLKMEVKLGETVCRIGEDNGRLCAVVPDSMAGTTQLLTVTFTGDTRFDPSAAFSAGSVTVPGQAPVTTLTATAGTVIWDGTNYLLPLTTDLTVRHAAVDKPAPDRSKLTVTLAGAPTTYTDDRTALSVLVPGELLGTSPTVVVSYPGESANNYPDATFTLPAVTLTDPAASTTLDAEAGKLTKNEVGEDYHIPLTVELAHEPYAGTEDAPNRGDIEITINDKDATYTVGAGDILNLDIPSELFYSTINIVVTYPGEARFKPSSKTLSDVKIPDPDPQPVDTTMVATVDGFAWNMAPGWGHCLVLNVAVNHLPYHGDEALSPNRALITVALDTVAVEPTELHWSGGKLYIPVGEALYNKTVSVTLKYPGESGYFNPSEQTLENVLIVDPSTLLVATTLTASAGALTKDSDDTYYIPLTVALTANGESEKTPGRADIVVKLNGAVVACDDDGEVFKLPIDASLFPSTTNTVSVEYTGDEWFLPSSKIINNVAIPNPIPAKTTLNFTVDKLLTSLTDSRRVLRLNVTLENAPYWADASLKPSRSDITVTLGSTSSEVIAVTETSIDVYIPSALLNTTTDVTVTYPGDAHFEASAKTLSGVALTDPVTPPSPPPVDNGGGGASTPTPKPSTDENAKITVSSKDATAAVKAAADSGSVVLKAEAKEGAKSVAVTVPASVMKDIAKADAPVSIQSSVADLTLDTKVLETLRATGTKDVVVSAGAADTAALPKAAQTALEGRPVYDISITSGGKSVSQFNGGNVTVALPYTPAAGESSGSLAAYWVKEDGSMEVLRNSVYKDGKLTFSTPHLSTYAILHREVSFLDVSSDLWFKNDITFTVARGILNGMGDDGTGGELFGPAITLTGKMAVVALARMDGVADGTGEGWAAPAIAWAVEKNILPEGFSADSPLTREQFAYLVTGYLGGAKTTNTPAYLDITQITSSCLGSVNYLTSISVMNGTGDGYFSPKLSLTRSELAAVLHRLVILQLG